MAISNFQRCRRRRKRQDWGETSIQFHINRYTCGSNLRPSSIPLHKNTARAKVTEPTYSYTFNFFHRSSTQLSPYSTKLPSLFLSTFLLFLICLLLGFQTNTTNNTLMYTIPTLSPLRVLGDVQILFTHVEQPKQNKSGSR